MTRGMKWLAGFVVFAVAVTIATSVGLAGAASQAGREVKVTGTILDWSAASFVVRDDSGKTRQFNVDKTTRIEGQPRKGSNVEVVSLQEGPLAMRVRVLAPPPAGRAVTVVGVIKSWSADKVTLDVSGKLIDFRMAGDFAKLQEGPLAKPVGQRVRVTYVDDGSSAVKTATSVTVQK